MLPPHLPKPIKKRDDTVRTLVRKTVPAGAPSLRVLGVVRAGRVSSPAPTANSSDTA